MTKGARSRAEVDPSFLEQLNAGTVEARTLSESLSVDLQKLAKNIGIVTRGLKEQTYLKRMKELGERLDDWKSFVNHPSDTVRGWACFKLGSLQSMNVAQMLDAIGPLAADSNAGVREWAWIALRPRVIEDLDLSLKILQPWTSSSDYRLRRYASEITRPRGVWCAHIRPLREDPTPGLKLLRPLRNDPEKYVQDSVANWLNDASKDHPQWVKDVCRDWQKKGAHQRILRRAQHSLG